MNSTSDQKLFTTCGFFRIVDDKITYKNDHLGSVKIYCMEKQEGATKTVKKQTMF